MAVVKNILLLGFAAGACYVAYGFYLDSQRNERIQSDLAKHDLAAFARDSIDDLYQVTTGISNDTDVKITEIGPALTIGSIQTTFNLDAARLVPQIFKSFPDIKNVELVRIMTGTNSRGNEDQVKAIEMIFSRPNSRSINWENIVFDNVPTIADKYWISPTLN